MKQGGKSKMELLKRTEEFSVATEEEAQTLIQAVKDKQYEEHYELASYSSTKKTSKEGDWVLVKVVKVY